MHHAFIDKYSDLKSPLHSLDPRIKIILAFLIILVSVTIPFPHFIPLVFIGLIALILWFISGIPLKHLLHRLAIAIPFVALMGAGMIFGQESSWEMRTDRFLHITLRAGLAISVLTLLGSTTPFPMFLEGLKWFKIPKVIHSLLSFIYRFIYIIIDEFQRANRGRQSREFRRNLLLTWKGRSYMIGSFLIRSIERSERVYGAMLARGYGEEKR